MKRTILAFAICAWPLGAAAQSVVADVVEGHILPRFETLAATSQSLADTAAQDCDPGSDALRQAFGTAFDAWIAASHLRFGPTEVEERAFALAFWPDSRGATPRTLARLMAEADPVASDPDRYGEVSIAARGFYALELLLYDDALGQGTDPAYRCTLIRTVTADIAGLSAAILDDWQPGYAKAMENPGPDGIYRSREDALQELFKALTAGLQFTSDTRLGRPLGTFDKPRPNRAEARRSGRSAAHVRISLTSLHDLAVRLAAGDSALVAEFEEEFDEALAQLDALNDPVFAGVAEPGARLRIEVLAQAIDAIRNTAAEYLGPRLSVAAGFNALDGD
ncbi:imelysin family protein [Thalassococcus sp. BH17M4-6]|uniref:imelysin family protein n=1 Tax=Thalassococcus sp. BH17M4-6 TaxID=3413148 RepID=UPI003BDCAF46